MPCSLYWQRSMWHQFMSLITNIRATKSIIINIMVLGSIQRELLDVIINYEREREKETEKTVITNSGNQVK